jgi:hypothetical protein
MRHGTGSLNTSTATRSIPQNKQLLVSRSDIGLFLFSERSARADRDEHVRRRQTMNEYTSIPELGPVANKLVPFATRRSIRVLWQAGSSRLYIEDTIKQANSSFGDLESTLNDAHIAHENAVGAFTGEEEAVLADQIDAEQQAVEHLPTAPHDILLASNAITTLFQKALFIATETAGVGFEQQISNAKPIREDARSMVGGVTIVIDGLDQIAEYHPDINHNDVTLPSQEAHWHGE